MTWSVEFDDAAAKELRKLDRQAQQEILRYFRERVATEEDPRRFGKPLSRDLAGFWRYRVRNYRMICSIEDSRLINLVLRVGHRKDIYDSVNSQGSGQGDGQRRLWQKTRPDPVFTTCYTVVTPA